MKWLITFVIPILLFPALVGSAAASVATAPPATRPPALFAWVPEEGYPDAFPFGQCTWWAAYNHQVSWNGNAGDWLANARAQGVTTTTMPSVGAIVVYRPGGPYSELGHVAIVTATRADGYVVSEMNAPAWGQVTTRELAWPDPDALGFIPTPDP